MKPVKSLKQFSNNIILKILLSQNPQMEKYIKT